MFAELLNANTGITPLPKEVQYLKCYNLALTSIGEHIDMSGNRIRNLIKFITENSMKLPLHRREKEFASSTDAEVLAIEKNVAEAFSQDYCSDWYEYRLSISPLQSREKNFYAAASFRSFCVRIFEVAGNGAIRFIP